MASLLNQPERFFFPRPVHAITFPARFKQVAERAEFGLEFFEIDRFFQVSLAVDRLGKD